ncbi:MAG: hypothetical protein ABWW69_01410 [Pyrodictiaceae archaeon]
MEGATEEENYIILLDKLADLVIRRAVGYSIEIHDSLFPKSIMPFVDRILESLPIELVEFDGTVYKCRLCGRGPFTRKGLYLHLKRVHVDQITIMIRDELDHYIWQLKNFRP